MKRTIAIVSFSLLLVCNQLAIASSTTVSPYVENLIKKMSIEEKVGQLLLVGFGGKQVDKDIESLITGKKVGGIALFARNISSPIQVASFIRQLNTSMANLIPPFIALDQEGGNVVRVKEGVIVLPGNMAMGATRSPTLAYLAGITQGVDLGMLGFNMNLAPVLDVNSNPRNPVIGIRSYGQSPNLVAELGSWFIKGQQESGLISVAKHFPGHGDTRGDSHFDLPIIAATEERLKTIELVPFQKAIDIGLDAVMTAHIAVPNVTGDTKLPSTLSEKLLSEILREQLHFDGVIITDGLEMHGIVDTYGSGRAAVKAILAGADMAMILWTHEKKEEVFNELMAAVKSGEISIERLNLSVRRILSLKEKRGIFKQKLPSIAVVKKHLEKNKLHHLVSAEIANNSITLMKNTDPTIPLDNQKHGKVLVVSPYGSFLKTMGASNKVETVKVTTIPSRTRRKAETQAVLDMASRYQTIVFAVINSYQVRMIKQIAPYLRDKHIIVVSLGSPYYYKEMPFVSGFLCSYSYRSQAQRAAALTLLGKIEPVGKLPVSIPGYFSYGHGLDFNQQPNQRYGQLMPRLEP